MTPFRDLSIGEKLMRLAVLASAVALVAASSAFIVYDVVTIRSALVRRLTTAADIVGYNSVSALLFQDEEAAAKTLEALRAEPHVIGAAIYGRDGRLFAVYPRPSSRKPAFSPPATSEALPTGAHLRAGRLLLARPIDFEGSPGGTVLIVSDLSEISTRLVRYGALVLLVSLMALGIAVAISGRFQRAVSRPLLELAGTARRVSEARDYGVRAAPAGRDEIGLLVETFNDMLAQIQRRDAEVNEARELLERRVEERTRDLMRELAERRRAEEAVRKNQALLDDAQRISEIGSFEWDAGSDEALWSDELYRIFDVDRATFVPTSAAIEARLVPEDRARFRELMQEALDPSGPSVQEYDIRIARRDGSVRTIHGHRRIERDAHGRLLRMIGLSQDVTDRRASEAQREEMIRVEGARAEAEAAERRAAFLARVSSVLASSLETERTLAAATGLSVPEFADWCVLDMLGGEGALVRMAVSHADPAKSSVFGELKSRSIRREGDSPAARVMKTGRLEVYGPDRALESDEPAHADLVRALGPGTVLAAPLLVHGEARGAMLWCRTRRGFDPPDVLLGDEIARRAAVAIEHAQLYQSAQKANRLKDEFLATLSHELRTPLHAIVGWAHMLRTGRLDAATVKKAIETIDRNAQAQNQLISDILEVSRIVAGKVRLHVEPIDLSRVALAAVDTVRPAAEAKSVQLTVDLPPDAGPVSGDADRLQQVVWNLLSNAIKFVPRGGHVEVRLAEDDGNVELSVADDGPGIAPEFLPHVFERFRQADSSSTRPHGGLGLGLAIVRHFVELHGGTVGARNRGTGGAVFTVSLPRRTTAPKWSPASAPGAEALWLDRGPSLTGLVVLIVDDEPDARDMLASVLELAGADVRRAESAAEALRILETVTPDVLLSDVEMPVEDGYALIAKVRILPADRAGRVPAAAITAYASAEDRARALAAGFDAHVAKPVEPSELVRVVAALAGRSPDREPAPRAPAPPARAAQDAPTVLVVEDDPDSAESLALLLEELGYRVVTARDGKEALQRAEESAPDVALVDISLPGMSGLELAHLLRGRPDLRKTTLIAMSGYGREQDVARSHAAGFRHHLVKPMDPSALGDLLASVTHQEAGQNRA